MQYLVVEQPEDYYGGGIQPLEFHDNEESAEKAAEMYSEEEKKTRIDRRWGREKEKRRLSLGQRAGAA